MINDTSEQGDLSVKIGGTERVGDRTYQDIFNAIPGAVFIQDPETGRILGTNACMRAMYGFDAHDDISDICFRDLSPNVEPYTEARAIALVKSADSVDTLAFEWRAKKKNGDIFWVEVSLKKALIHGVPLVIALVLDISDRKRVEEEALGKQLFSEALTKSLPGIFYLYTYPELRLQYWNKNFESLLAYTDEELKNFYLPDWFKPELKDQVLKAVEVAMEKGMNTLEADLQIKNGKSVPCLMTGVRFESSGKTYLVGVGIDISDRKRAEAALRESEAQKRAMLENIADVITILDENAVIRYKSSNVERWFGWKSEELIGIIAWDNIHPDDCFRLKTIFGILLEEPRTPMTFQSRYRCKDESYKWIEFTAVNLLHDPDIRGILVNYQDISKRKRNEEEKQKLQNQLLQAQKMESVGRLAGGVAHDFNNMLSIIIGRAELALMKLDSSDPLFADLCEIEAVGKRSADLTGQLLAFARKQAIAPRIMDLNKTIDSMLSMIRRLIGENISLIWKPCDYIWNVKMDQAQIDQLLANLMVNARDSISDVGVITIETANLELDRSCCESHVDFTPGDYVLLAVSDSGCGMDDETLAHIFEPFFTTKTLGQGTGLGLSTVYGIVKQNKGFITIASEQGKGSTFKIYLPRSLENIPARQGNHLDETRPMGGTETIVLVEDEPAILEVTQTMLEALGYTVLASGSPVTAREIAAGHPGAIDLLLSDVVMPEMNGLELSKQLLSQFPNLKHLFMSGYTADVIAHRGVLDKGVNFIQKPFTMKELALKVRGVLDSDTL